MSERLDELRRQRALAQEQLAWLDREIARESGPGSKPAPAATAPAPAATPTAMSTEAARAADEILARYRDESPNTERDVKRGCYLYFVLALVLLFLSALGAYLVYTHWR
jgi:hypothetical protein